MITFIKKIRARVMRFIIPKNKYSLLKNRNLRPISNKYGFDRGTPIDRFYIEKFIQKYKNDIKGVCLEITDNTYTKKYGGNKVIKSDVLDINRNNSKANIFGDLKSLNNIQDNYYDCIILTQTLGVIDDFQKAILETHRILKKDGIILVTVTSIGPAWDVQNNYWRFTGRGLEFALKQIYKSVNSETYGNVLSGQAFWIGLSAQELNEKELNFNDKTFPVIATAKAIK